MRAGFTMIEALVALVMFEVGILALVASGSVIARDMAAANRRLHARAVATARIEQLRASCPAPTGGHADAAAGVTEDWRVEAFGITRSLVDSVEYQLPGTRTARVVLRSSLLCDR
jgi:Tfp pilus assembly protein PilV